MASNRADSFRGSPATRLLQLRKVGPHLSIGVAEEDASVEEEGIQSRQRIANSGGKRDGLPQIGVTR